MGKLKMASRREVQAEIATTLESTLSDLKENLSERKFKRNIRRASKILILGLKGGRKNRKAEKQVKTVKQSKASKNKAAGKGTNGVAANHASSGNANGTVAVENAQA